MSAQLINQHELSLNGKHHSGTFFSPMSNYDLNDESSAHEFLVANMARGDKGLFTIVVNMTPILATILLTLNNRNRSVRAQEVKRYERIIKEHRWILHSQGISIGSDGVMNNGQHRLKAIVNTGITVPINFSFGESPEAFHVLDRQRSRSGSDTLTVANEKNTSSLAAGLRLLLNIERGSAHHPISVDNDQLLPLLERHGGLRDTQVDGTRLKSSVGTSGSGTAVAIYLIKMKTRFPNRVDDFVDRLVTGAGIDDTTNPILTLRKKLTLRTGLKANEIASNIIKCWNAWIEHKRPRAFNWGDDEDFPIAI